MKYFQDIIAVNNCSLQTNSLTGMGEKKRLCTASFPGVSCA